MLLFEKFLTYLIILMHPIFIKINTRLLIPRHFLPLEIIIFVVHGIVLLENRIQLNGDF